MALGSLSLPPITQSGPTDNQKPVFVSTCLPCPPLTTSSSAPVPGAMRGHLGCFQHFSEMFRVLTWAASVLQPNNQLPSTLYQLLWYLGALVYLPVILKPFKLLTPPGWHALVH